MDRPVFTLDHKVLFRHCDPAGIVFYPRIFEMANDCIEAFFAEALDWSFEDLLREAGLPTVATEATFHAPSRHGDVLSLRLFADVPGRSSLNYRLEAHAGDEARFTIRATLVHVGPDLRPAPWPDRIRRRLTELKEGQP